MQFEIKRIWIDKNIAQTNDWKRLLQSCGIRHEESVHYCYGVYEGSLLIASGSIFCNIIKCVAVDPSYQGTEVINILISYLVNEVFSSDNKKCFVYTKPETVTEFSYFGFVEIARVPGELVLLEKSVSGFPTFIQHLQSLRVPGEHIAAIVMNANPFTNGHLYLVEHAAAQSDVLHIFVLSEDVSAFGAEVRRSLVTQGVQHLSNVYVHETGDYMVSEKSFPAYFLREDVNVTKVQAQLDAIIFRDYIAPSLGITKRYVGEEPLSFATSIYNTAMAEVFAGHISFQVIPRMMYKHDVISASRVRACMVDGNIDDIKHLVPATTWDFITSDKGKQVQEKLKLLQ